MPHLQQQVPPQLPVPHPQLLVLALLLEGNAWRYPTSTILSSFSQTDSISCLFGDLVAIRQEVIEAENQLSLPHEQRRHLLNHAWRVQPATNRSLR